MKIIAEGILTHVGPKKLLRLVNVDVEMKFSVKEITSKERINQCVKDFKEYCIVSNSIASGLPIKVNCIKI